MIQLEHVISMGRDESKNAGVIENESYIMQLSNPECLVVAELKGCRTKIIISILSLPIWQ